MTETIPPRTVLHAALAIGCSRWMPINRAAVDARQGSRSPAAPKALPASVHYQTQPKGDEKCSACLNFSAGSDTCKLLAGPVTAEGWCGLWGSQA